MARDSFIFYRSFYESISEADTETQVNLYDAICRKALYDEDTLLDGTAKMLYTLIKPQLEANSKRYSDGQKGGRPKKETTGFNNEETTGFENKKPNNNENVNVNENDNVNEQEEKIHFAEFVSMTNVEHEKLVNTYGEDFTNQCITELDNYKGSKGKKYKSDYRAILSWVIDKIKSKGITPNPVRKKEEKKEICFDVSDLTQEQYALYMQGKLTSDDIRKILEGKNV